SPPRATARPAGVRRAGGGPASAPPPAPPLDGPVRPPSEAASRLPECYGGFALSYRFLIDEGRRTVATDAGDVTRKSRLNVNVWDFDYVSARYEPLPRWDLRWRVGIRAVTNFYDARETLGVFETRASNYYTGVGPHAAFEVSRELPVLSSLAVMARLDGAVLLGNDKQRYYDIAAAPVNGDETDVLGQRRSQSAQMLRAELGLRYTPAALETLHFSTGYQVEHWWGLAGPGGTNVELATQGIFFRGQIDF